MSTRTRAHPARRRRSCCWAEPRRPEVHRRRNRRHRGTWVHRQESGLVGSDGGHVQRHRRRTHVAGRDREHAAGRESTRSAKTGAGVGDPAWSGRRHARRPGRREPGGEVDNHIRRGRGVHAHVTVDRRVSRSWSWRCHGRLQSSPSMSSGSCRTRVHRQVPADVRPDGGHVQRRRGHVRRYADRCRDLHAQHAVGAETAGPPCPERVSARRSGSTGVSRTWPGRLGAGGGCRTDGDGESVGAVRAVRAEAGRRRAEPGRPDLDRVPADWARCLQHVRPSRPLGPAIPQRRPQWGCRWRRRRLARCGS